MDTIARIVIGYLTRHLEPGKGVGEPTHFKQLTLPRRSDSLFPRLRRRVARQALHSA